VASDAKRALLLLFFCDNKPQDVPWQATHEMEGIHAPAKVQASTNEDVREKIAIQSREKYEQEPKPLQVETVSI
jgi:hypothetical protein